MPDENSTDTQTPTNGQTATQPPATPPAPSEPEKKYSQKEFDDHLAGLKGKYEKKLAKANEALAEAKGKLGAADGAKKPDTDTNGAPAEGEQPTPQVQELSAKLDSLVDVVSTLATSYQKQESRSREGQYEAALTKHESLSDAQKSMMRTLYNGLEKPPEDVAAWVNENAAVFGAAPKADPSKETETVDPTKDKTDAGDSSGISDGGAPAGPAAYEGVIDLASASSDTIVALRQRGKLFEKLEQYRDNLPGGSGSIFGKRPE